MARSRAAIDTIRGYFYQFDHYILKLLEASNDSDTVYIGGIEDIDINTTDETIAIQCKYYEKTEYNHSVIGKPIRLMLRHYADSLKKREPIIKYAIYGHYSSGQNKLSDNRDIQFYKKHFFTYSKEKLYEELRLNDKKLADFIQNLTININAPSYEKQEKQIHNKIKQIFHCTDYEADYYYNNALREVKKLSTMKKEKDRRITKQVFLSHIEKNEVLFDIWFLKKRGIDKYCKSVKSKYFTINNISPYERFFLIDCDNLISDTDLKTLLQNIAGKWSKLSQRSKDTFCPFIYLHNISDDRLMMIKKLLQSDTFLFSDGYAFKGADLSVNLICEKATWQNKIKLKIINEKNEINDIINYLSTVREIYQFFINEPFYENTTHKHIKIAIEETKTINQII